jgi:hypothetical protein
LTELQILTGIFSGASGLVLFPPARYGYWWKWTRKLAFVGVPVLFATNGGIGLVSYALAHALHWDPPGTTVLAAAQYAVAGQALVRTQLRGYDLDRADGALTLLSTAGGFVVDSLDALARPAVGRWVRDRSDDDVRLKVYEILEDEIATDRRVDQAVVEQLTANMDAWSNEMSTGDRAKGRGAMNGFCIRQIRDRHLTV